MVQTLRWIFPSLEKTEEKWSKSEKLIMWIWVSIYHNQISICECVFVYAMENKWKKMKHKKNIGQDLHIKMIAIYGELIIILFLQRLINGEKIGISF